MATATIEECFEISATKKRELSNTSIEDDNAKKLKEGSLNSTLDTNDKSEEVFTNDSGSEEHEKSLFDTVKEMQRQILTLINTTNEVKERQIKGESHLNELTKSLKHFSEKIDDYEKERKEKDEIIKTMQGRIDTLSGKIDSLTMHLDNQCQYSRRNCLLIHGLKESNSENTDNLAIKNLNEHIGTSLTSADIDRSHRLGKKKEPGTKPRPIIVKFLRYNDRSKVFKNKKRLKGTRISITESLTGTRMRFLTETRDEYGFQDVWTVDGRILYKDAKGCVSVYYG